VDLSDVFVSQRPVPAAFQAGRRYPRLFALVALVPSPALSPVTSSIFHGYITS
jgi:hypothetical protein